ncbi:MAG: hypothetical protein J5I93_19910 [Pirellulaceae bacterium]|nr:hypothetical protein [Pirellulaceae bacterium]
MSVYDEWTADEILEKVMRDSLVDADEVRALERRLQRDWVVDRSEVELLFRVNQALGERAEQCGEWTEFFVNHVARLLIMDIDTPGEIDQAEGDWLAGMLDQYGTGNSAESALLGALQRSATRVSGRLVERLG